ncbi:MAG TPA: hypothetical protein PK079_24925 [Leptospiraceae bacterium]|nr:hypothetical protein [Leptospiraceae bacterium]HMW08475.1 hypothetical protein [Leptospiraceae bacterium]HMX33942.1 hypothetical protein [Leptospiraceae bacterium]HMY34235.1 hypothetical protein [Leptospiraceae bacterium]HMZ67372.1 hypothetical protein [Leptospiraceae bacterium]
MFKSIVTKKFSSVLFLAFALLTNCIEFHTRDYNESRPISSYTNKIELQVIPEKASQGCERDFKEPVQTTFIKLLNNENLIANNSADIVLLEKCEKEKAGEIKWIFLANFTLTLWSWGLIPCYAKHIEKASIAVSYKNREFKTYNYENVRHTIIWLFFFPTLFFDNTKPYERFLSATGQDLYHDLNQTIQKQEEEKLIKELESPKK